MNNYRQNKKDTESNLDEFKRRLNIMQGPQDNLDGLRGELLRKGKVDSSSREATYLLLSNKLYFDYAKAYSKFRGVEVEHFAEEWIKKNIPDNDRIMARSVWRYLICRLLECKKGRNK